jgi:glycosyltransferase involved in cell wall biosynthesis
MKISLDIQAAVTQQAGIGRYARMLAAQLPGIAAQHDHTMQLVHFDFRRNAAGIQSPHAQQKVIRWCPGALMQQAWKRLHWPPFDAIAGEADIFHFPNFIIPPLRRGKAVVTVHDVSFLHFPEFAEARNLAYLKTHLPRTLDRADAIITISENSKSEICDMLGADPERVHVTHLGISPDFTRASKAEQDALRKQLGLERPFIFTLGTVEPRKNHLLLLQAFERMDNPDIDLVIAGGQGWKSEPFFERLASSPARDRIHYLEYAPDGSLPALYSAAALFATPSFYEGFGFPPLEALACGTPVVSSMGGSLPEVLGSVATLVEPFDPDAWAEALATTLATTPTDATRDTYAAHAHSFTWDRTLNQTLDVYEKIAP